jgi:starvation-inducible DNA-binding protein
LNERVIDHLKHTQANALTMYLNSKRYHWFTYGPLFRDLHLFFDELAAAALAEVDPFGERIRMLGGEPLSKPAEIEYWGTVHIADGQQTPRQMLEEALANEQRIIAEMREAAAVADEAGDPGTNDLYATAVQTHEKHAWFIQEFLRGEDDMVHTNAVSARARV